MPGRPPGTPGPTLPPGWATGLPPGVLLPPGYANHPYLLARPRPHGLPVAPLGLRLVARLIDIAAVLALNVVGNGFFVYLWIKDLSPYFAAAMRGENVDLSNVPGQFQLLEWLIPLVAAALWFAYEVPGTASGGQTLGKRVVGLKVMALESEAPIGFGRAFRRWNPLGLPVLLWSCFGVGFVLQFVDCLSVPLGGPLQLALHDRSARTVVVHCGRRGHEKTPEKAPAQTGGGQR
jgi:uncharacterized RDD family membrane protein YckC